ncbi:probable G-protein coupled receptor 132 isoform X2 [Ursus maritimus]|uniref:Probable G-protein coupled receptor 132 isoform X2 n=1 Tax=Ursus maritimus TaxID=29073 RepID=A0A384DC15_URSMA|nr:probable G-protein coupled receptor 132 isoform X2 [Ursus maritimus]XP_040497243.1 probable G-protein coupled receptor 132 isoform X2 [Ursus maritimus]XP_040497244.1 probable G-protein coupled receptor 132 isoform X2 [Ursus maritimus]
MKLEPSNMPGNASAVTSSVPVAVLPGMGAATCNGSFEDSRVLLVVVYSLVCVLGLPANCLTAWLALLQVLQGNVLAVYLFCLALCELLYISTLPLWAIYIQNQHRWTLGVWACRVTGYIFFCNLYVSILFLCCVSCDRFMAVVYALESRGRRHQWTAVLVSVSVFIVVGLAHCPVFKMEEKETCFEASMDSEIAGYYYSRFAVGFAVPLLIIAFTNQRIFRTVRRSAGLSAAQKAKVKHSAIAVVTIFLVCFAPYHLVLLTKAVAYSYYRGDPGVMRTFEANLCKLSAMFLCLSTVNSVADPIIYMLATDHSRQEVSRIHKEWKKCSAKTDVAKHACSKDSEELPLPMSLTNDSTFPRTVHPSESEPAAWGSLDTLERLSEQSR